MQKSGLTPDAFLYTGLITAFGKAKMPEKAYPFEEVSVLFCDYNRYHMFKHMEATNVKPDRIAYISLLDTLMRNGQMELASEVTGLGRQVSGLLIDFIR